MESKKYLKVRNVLAAILILNILVAMAKLIYGLITDTSSMVADGYHSFSDGASNVVGIIGIWVASKPADENHPYGHHKFETLSTIVISLLLFFVSFQILSKAYTRFQNPVLPNIDIYNYLVMILTLIINIFVVRYEAKKGRELKSSILISDSKHTKSDIYVSISVLVSLIAVKLGLVFIDTIVAAIIAVLIIKAGIEILVPGIQILSDANIMDRDKIHDLVMIMPEVIFCHKIRTRGKEDHVMIDLHVGVDKEFTLEYAHLLAHSIEDMLKSKLEGIEEVIVHMEPASLQEEDLHKKQLVEARVRDKTKRK
ncbi:cation diffusion facilitator family transporter [Sporosalibacterium faouarense]|uniref:cation diffusion facilitator family transporter n=1 Tax=Sporosalibacterium faouarense TaxID=516123 RepID=UPI00192A7DDF|nr:cation diffusion facilitator family transporter [Sporosalibacterium faouarense]